jgi:peptidoglycan/xylan/chitin deacetylase (PgdA/CDA1 family)
MFNWLIKAYSEFNCSVKGVNKLNIVTYHRVSNGRDVTNPKNIQYQEFVDQLSWLKKHFVVLPLPLALELCEKNKLPKRAVCITVDDGYSDSYDIIFKVLKAADLNATFFISTEGLKRGSLWDERIYHAIFSAPSSILKIKLGDITYSLGSQHERIKSRYRLTELAKGMTLIEREQLINSLYTLCTAEEEYNIFLTGEQIKEIHNAGMTIGAHTHRHPILAQEEASCAYDEIKKSKDILEGILNYPVNYFAYPNGKLDKDFTDEHIDMVNKIGFHAALSTDWGALSDMKKDRFKIKRFTPWDRTEFRFAFRLAHNYRN